MLLLFLTRGLGLEPGVVGVLFPVGGVCSMLGATLAERVVRRLGLGPTLILTLCITSAGLLLVPLAAGPFVVVVGLVGAQQLAGWSGHHLPDPRDEPDPGDGSEALAWPGDGQSARGQLERYPRWHSRRLAPGGGARPASNDVGRRGGGATGAALAALVAGAGAAHDAGRERRRGR